MALEAADFTLVRSYRDPFQKGIRHAIYDVVLDDSYLKGTGFAFAASLVNMTTIDFIICDGPIGYVCKYDYTNNKLLVYEGPANVADAPLAECESSDSNLNTAALRVWVQGV